VLLVVSFYVGGVPMLGSSAAASVVVLSSRSAARSASSVTFGFLSDV
jgi:hypothetical protein